MTRVDTSRSAVMSRVRHVDLTAASIEMDALIAAVRAEVWEEAARMCEQMADASSESGIGPLFHAGVVMAARELAARLRERGKG